MPANVRNLGLARLLNPDDFDDPRSNPYADEPVDPPPDAPEPEASPEVSIDVGPPTIRSERPIAPPPEAPPPGRFGIGRMVPMVPGRGAAPEPAPARSPLVPAAGGRSPAPAAPKGDSLLELLQAQRHDSLVRGANSVGDALYGAFTRTKAAPAQGSNMAGEMGARDALADKEAARAKAARLEQAAAIDADPSSEASRAAQAMGQELLPNFLPPETWSRLSKAQIEKAFPVLKDIESSRAQREFARTKREEDRKNKLTDLETARENRLADRDALWSETRNRDVRLDASRKERAEIMAGAKQDAEERKAGREETKLRKESYLEGYELGPEAAPREVEAADLRSAQAATNTMRQTAEQIADLYRQYGTEALPTEARARMKALVRDLQLQSKGKGLYELGVLTGPDLMLLEQLVPDPTNRDANLLDFLGGAQILPTLDVFTQQAGRKFENAARARGFRKVGSGPSPERQKRKEEIGRQLEEIRRKLATPTQGAP